MLPHVTLHASVHVTVEMSHFVKILTCTANASKLIENCFLVLTLFRPGESLGIPLKVFAHNV